jgi:hypothetical protein
MSQSDEKPVFHDTRYVGKPAGEPARVGNAAETGIENEVSLIRDENMTVRLHSQM